MQVPESETWRILIGACIIGLRLQATVEIDVQPILPPGMMIVGSNGSRMAHATFEHRPLITALGACIGIDIVCREIKALEDVGRHIHLHAFHITLVAVLIEGVAHHLVSLVLRHLWELFHQHHAGSVIHRYILLHHHIVDAIQEASDAYSQELGTVFGIE